MEKAEHEDALENEWYAVRHSGEIPEIALFSAFYYLTKDTSGPRITLTADQCQTLVEAAELRYREIVLRDIQHRNRGTGAYRGIRRSIYNWHRFETFCTRQKVDYGSFRHEVAAALLVFLAEELVDVERGERPSSINCSFLELNRFATRLGLVPEALPDCIKPLCCG